MSATHVTELDTELRYFDEHRSELLRNACGKYALVKDENLVGIFDSENAAIRHGYETLGNVPFLVKRITEVDIPLNFTSFNLGVQLPSFEVSAPDLKAAGPILQVSIGPSREIIAALGHDAVAAPTLVSALVDTGAAVTVITPETAKLLALRSVGLTPIHTPTTIEPVMCREFHVNVYLSAAVVVENVLAVEAPLTGQPFQCLIGRDVLSRGILNYDGVNNRFSLTF